MSKKLSASSELFRADTMIRWRLKYSRSVGKSTLQATAVFTEYTLHTNPCLSWSPGLSAVLAIAGQSPL